MTREQFDREVAERRALYELAKEKGDRMGMRYWADAEMQWFARRADLLTNGETNGQ
jgi:hypothetical protein